MYRAEIEKMMKEQKVTCIALHYKENEPGGAYCFLRGGYLYDYTGKRVDRKLDIWGYNIFINGKPVRVPLTKESKL